MKFKMFILSTLFLGTLLFSAHSLKDSMVIRREIAKEPVDFSYSFDGFSFLKTFYHMRNGEDFYQANMTGILNDARKGSPPIFISGWRMPTVFWIWSVLTMNGERIWFLFFVLSIISMWAAFDISRFFGGRMASFITALVLFPYFYFALTSYQFLLMEWWAVCFFIIGLSLLLRTRKEGILLLLLAALTREFFMIPILCGLVFSIIFKKRILATLFLGAILVFSIFYYVHYINSAAILKLYNGLTLGFFGQNFGNGGIVFLRKTLAYGTNFFPSSKLGIQLPLLIFITSILSGLYTFYKKRVFEVYFVFGTFFSFVLAFLFLGTPDNDYWGAMYAPLLYILFPGFFSFLSSNKTL